MKITKIRTGGISHSKTKSKTTLFFLSWLSKKIMMRKFVRFKNKLDKHLGAKMNSQNLILKRSRMPGL
jgi:hypothetical protein